MRAERGVAVTGTLVMLSAVLACADSAGTNGPDGPVPDNLAVQEVVSGLSSPVYLTAPSGDARLFVVEQPGRIRIVQNGQLVAASFLDITDVVGSGGERGLLGMAFHPQYAVNGYFYVNYTDNSGDTRIERYTVSGDPNVADRGSARLVLRVPQPFSNHNGGLVIFGPDGMLYIGMGDGGSGGDPQGNGQDLTTLLGALLRIDVDGGDPYAIPPDNPFAGDPSVRQEIWAYGLRNPWRFAFDDQEGLLYIADVGQNALEEINVVPAASAARNYGWNTMEGTECHAASNCDQTGLTLPVVVYATTSANCSVIGGFVYRGGAIPELAGRYFYSDFCGGWLRSILYANGAVVEQRVWEVGSLGSVLSFGQDGAGELYVLSSSGGRVYRLVAGS